MERVGNLRRPRNVKRWVLSGLVAVVVCALMNGCAMINPYRLDDQVEEFHNDLRWGRITAAEQAWGSQSRQQFARRHAAWGRTIQIVDVELEPIRNRGMMAIVRAKFTWIRSNETEVRESTLETRWRPGMHGSWILEEERIIGGDQSIINTVPTNPPTATNQSPTNYESAGTTNTVSNASGDRTNQQ